MNYTWKTFKELKGRINKNKTRMLYDHLTTSAAILLAKVKNMYELTDNKMEITKDKYNNDLEVEFEAKKDGKDFDEKNFERE